MRIRAVGGNFYSFPDTANINRDSPFPGWFTVVVADESAPNKQRVTWFNSYHVISVESGDANVGG